MASIVACVPNLMDRSKFPAGVQFVTTAADVDGYDPTLIVVDIDRCDDVASFLVKGIEVIGFGSHIESELAAAALAAGYNAVYPRSVFFKRLVGSLAG